MSEMVDRVRKAIDGARHHVVVRNKAVTSSHYEIRYCDDDVLSDETIHVVEYNSTFEVAQSRAIELDSEARGRAAIEAMREPTDVMCDAADTRDTLGGHGFGDKCYQARADDVWRKMIDAALKE